MFAKRPEHHNHIPGSLQANDGPVSGLARVFHIDECFFVSVSQAEPLLALLGRPFGRRIRLRRALGSAPLRDQGWVFSEIYMSKQQDLQIQLLAADPS